MSFPSTAPSSYTQSLSSYGTQWTARERMALPPLSVLPRHFTAEQHFERINHSTASVVYASPAIMTSATAQSPVTVFGAKMQSPAKKRLRALPNASKSITLDLLRPHFEKPLAEVAALFGICMTLMKKICRKNGVGRWPHRQIRGLRKSIWSIEKALRCCESDVQRRSYNDHLQKQRAKLLTILKGPENRKSKDEFDQVLAETSSACSPMSGLVTPTTDSEKADTPTSVHGISSVIYRQQGVSPANHSVYTSYTSPVAAASPSMVRPIPSGTMVFNGKASLAPMVGKLPSIASLLMKTRQEERRRQFPASTGSFQF